MKADKMYDVTCTECGRHLSTDFGMGTFETASEAIKIAKSDGWQSNGSHGNKCGVCNGTHEVTGSTENKFAKRKVTR